MTIKMPMQPIKDARFESNPIVDWLCTEVSDMNKISIWCQENNVDTSYQEQLAQLVGYSVSGYGSLSYVSDDSYEKAAIVVATGMTEHDHLQAENERLREALGEIIHLMHHPLTIDLKQVKHSTESKNAIKLLKGDSDG